MTHSSMKEHICFILRGGAVSAKCRPSYKYGGGGVTGIHTQKFENYDVINCLYGYDRVYNTITKYNVSIGFIISRKYVHGQRT